jgi:hypothetical protein
VTRVRVAFDRAPAPDAADELPPLAPRRIWEVDVDAVRGIVPAVLGREGMRRVLARHGVPDAGRDARLALDIVARCLRPCSLAEDVERELDRRTAGLRHFCARSPVAMLAAWWAQADDEDRPALLWSIASDPRLDLDRAAWPRPCAG